jgi:small subunit ribosomal protein S6
MSKTNTYEVIYILKPDLIEDSLLKTIETYQTLLIDSEVHNLTTQNRGRRPFKYPIKKFNDGIYIQMNFDSNPLALPTMEKSMKLDENILRSLVTKLNK